MNNVSTKTSYIVKISLLSAIALVLMFLEFPIFPQFNWLKLDPSDLPALIGSFTFGPVAGIVIELIKNILAIIFKNSGTGGVGELANFFVGAAFVGSAGWIYIKNKTRKTAVLSMVAGTIAMGILGVLANYFVFMPLYKMNYAPQDWQINYLVYGVLPFNLIKALMVSVLTMVVYKRVSVIIHSERNNPNTGNKEKRTA